MHQFRPSCFACCQMLHRCVECLAMLAMVPMQVLQLQSQLQDLSSQGADELNDIKQKFAERLAAVQTELEQQEADKAALLDIVQVQCFLFTTTTLVTKKGCADTKLSILVRVQSLVANCLFLL